MRYCIPDELFNLIPYPSDGLNEVGIDGMEQEVAYKLPGAEVVVVKREIWHALCDFCTRTGALQQRLTNTRGPQVDVSPQNGKFMRIVGAEKLFVEPPETEGGDPVEIGGERTADFTVTPVQGGGLVANFPDADACALYISVRPQFDDRTGDGYGNWEPKVPQYIIDRYGECITHGALARLYAMRGEGGLARMHATAYNNDLNRLSFGLITSGMRKHLLIDIEDWLVNTNGNG